MSRKAQANKKTHADGTETWTGTWYHQSHTYCGVALQRIAKNPNSPKSCRGHKDGLSGLATEADALAAAYARQNAEAANPSAIVSNESTTLEEVFNLWYSSGPANIKSPKTLDGYAERFRAWKNHEPTLGYIHVKDVTPAHIAKWLGGLRDRGLSASTMRQDLYAIRHALRYATQLGLIDKEPTEGLKAPASLQGIPTKRDRLTIEQVRLAADHLGQRNPKLRLAVLLAAYTGLRLGELLGLRAEKIDRTTMPNYITVDSQWDEGTKTRPAGFKLPKRNKTRQVPVTPDLEHDLAKHLLQFPASSNELGLVFATRAGTPLRQSNFRKLWNQTLSELGLPAVSPHSLRATFVDLWIDSGRFLPSDVRDMAGHKDIGVTMNTYKGEATPTQLGAKMLAHEDPKQPTPGRTLPGSLVVIAP